MPEPQYDFFSYWPNEIPDKPKSKPKARSKLQSISEPEQTPQPELDREYETSTRGEASTDFPLTPSGVDLPPGVKVIGSCPDGGDLVRFMHERGLWPGKNGKHTPVLIERIQENIAKWKRAGRTPVYKGVPADQLIGKGWKQVTRFAGGEGRIGLNWIEPKALRDESNGKRPNEDQDQPRRTRKDQVV